MNLPGINMSLQNLFSKLFGQNKTKIQTFTYYIPAPPPRNTGYREKQFDRIMTEITSKGFEIVDFKTQALSREKWSGIWVIFLLRPNNKNIDLNNLDFDSIDNEDKKVPLEGLYHLD